MKEYFDYILGLIAIVAFIWFAVYLHELLMKIATLINFDVEKMLFIFWAYIISFVYRALKTK